MNLPSFRQFLHLSPDYLPVTIRFSKEENVYLMCTVRKESEKANWKLIRAWVADRTGRELRLLKEAE